MRLIASARVGSARARRRADAQERAARHEVRQHAVALDVLAAAAVARLAADADLDEVRRRQIAPHGVHARAQQRAPRLGAGARTASGLVVDAAGRLLPQHGELALQRARQRLLVGDLERESPRRRQQAIDHLALVAGRVGAVERAQRAVEVGVGVVTEDAGLVPDPARAQTRALAHHHGIALETKRRRLEHERDRQDQLGLGRRDGGGARTPLVGHLHAREVLAVPPADHLGDAIHVRAHARRRDANEARAALALEAGPIGLEMKLRPVERSANARAVGQSRHLVHRRARPRRVDLAVAWLADLRSNVVLAKDVAGDGGAMRIAAGRRRDRARRRRPRRLTGNRSPRRGTAASREPTRCRNDGTGNDGVQQRSRKRSHRPVAHHRRQSPFDPLLVAMEKNQNAWGGDGSPVAAHRGRVWEPFEGSREKRSAERGCRHCRIQMAAVTFGYGGAGVFGPGRTGTQDLYL